MSIAGLLDRCLRAALLPAAAIRIGAELARGAGGAFYAEHIIDTGRRTPIERLAHFLLEMHSRLAMVGRAEPSSFELPFSQEIMSDALGLSVPHLNRMLSQLRFEGLVKVANRRVEFPDLKAIHVRAQFQPLKLTRIPAIA